MRRSAIGRTAKLASLPMGFAGRTAVGVGKRVAGKPAEIVMSEVQARTADQLFKVLGELKGGAMKLGQAMSIFESALPDELVAPYRDTLTRLQDAAPPMSTRVLNQAMSEEFGEDWREFFQEFDDKPVASASIGQVHRATWNDGRDVAVKIQYPGAAKALRSDLKSLSRLARMFTILAPGVDIKPLLAEIEERVSEELDYTLEAQNQQAFALAYADDPDYVVPSVVAHGEKVLVSTWMDSKYSLAHVIREGTQEERNHFGALYAKFHVAAPGRLGLLHADPHPGNFRVLEDGRLGIVDFGAVARVPNGIPRPMGEMIRMAADENWAGVEAGLRAEGFLLERVKFDPEQLADYLGPFAEGARVDEFSFNRRWLRRQAARVATPTAENFSNAFKLNLPPDYMLLHRVMVGGIGVLCQLETTMNYRGLLMEHFPGFANGSAA